MRQLIKAVMQIACCAIALGLPVRMVAQSEPQADPQGITANREQAAISTASRSGEVASSELPDSPGTSWANDQQTSAQQDSSLQSATPSSPQAGTSQTAADQEPSQKLQRPVGTAAAEAPKVSGVTAAEPAGVAIAPAKQRRVRTIVLKVGAMVGAGVALGTVIALTTATPSKPPGAH